jgi:hypothetical protein
VRDRQHGERGRKKHRREKSRASRCGQAEVLGRFKNRPDEQYRNRDRKQRPGIAEPVEKLGVGRRWFDPARTCLENDHLKSKDRRNNQEQEEQAE